MIFTLTHSFFIASWPVKLVMLTLLASSIISWGIVLQATQSISLSRKRNERFYHQFKNALPLTCPKEKLTLSENNMLYQMFNKASDTYQYLYDSGYLASSSKNFTVLIKRDMKVIESECIDKIYSPLAYLATIGSISPYIGLLGTVFGIINAFQSLSHFALSGSNISMLAPGIAEALLTTALGLFVAIPAVIFYNHFMHQIEKIQAQCENFQHRMINYLEVKDD